MANAKRKGLSTDSKVLRGRETLPYEYALEFFFQRSYLELLEEAERTKVCSEADLLDMGRFLYADLLRLVRGEKSALSFPKRLPHPGEFAPL